MNIILFVRVSLLLFCLTTCLLSWLYYGKIREGATIKQAFELKQKKTQQRLNSEKKKLKRLLLEKKLLQESFGNFKKKNIPGSCLKAEQIEWFLNAWQLMVFCRTGKQLHIPSNVENDKHIKIGAEMLQVMGDHLWSRTKAIRVPPECLMSTKSEMILCYQRGTHAILTRVLKDCLRGEYSSATYTRSGTSFVINSGYYKSKFGARKNFRKCWLRTVRDAEEEIGPKLKIK